MLHGGVIDLTVGRGGATSPPLAEVAAEMAIRSPSWDADAIFSAWATGTLDIIRQDLADEALALWRLFVRTAGTAGIDAEEATGAWISDRSRLRLVNAGLNGSRESGVRRRAEKSPRPERRHHDHGASE